MASVTPAVKISLGHDEYEKLSMLPWFSYRVNLPVRPLPDLTERAPMRTERLLVRPIVPSDLEAFHELRRETETQIHSTLRGRPDRNIEETRRNLEQLQPPYDQRHWYFGAFLASTGELIGEGGLPDCEDMPRSGWPEAEILIKSAHRRRGYGTELYRAVMASWWALPRERRRHQLLPIAAGDTEPGDEVADGVGFVWEGDNDAARAFFARMTGHDLVSAEGSWIDFERRDGRDLGLVTWEGTLTTNPLGWKVNTARL
ncbi:GNAT domain-containing protein [Xylariales sp. PMI_506]|nr:GNAT domain-containing protein [Xylariales sp. PMI_506]